MMNSNRRNIAVIGASVVLAVAAVAWITWSQFSFHVNVSYDEQVTPWQSTQIRDILNQQGSVDDIKIAVEANPSSLDRPDFSGCFPIHSAAWLERSDVIEFLLLYGDEPNRRVQMPGDVFDGYTALHISALLGDIKTAKILLEHGAAADLVGADGKTPIDIAQSRGYDDIVEILMAND